MKNDPTEEGITVARNPFSFNRLEPWRQIQHNANPAMQIAEEK